MSSTTFCRAAEGLEAALRNESGAGVDAATRAMTEAWDSFLATAPANEHATIELVRDYFDDIADILIETRADPTEAAAQLSGPDGPFSDRARERVAEPMAHMAELVEARCDLSLYLPDPPPIAPSDDEAPAPPVPGS
jgi:hypothetical protein